MQGLMPLPFPRPSGDPDWFEVRGYDPISDMWFYIDTRDTWEGIEGTVLSIAAHRRHPIEIWVAERIHTHPGMGEEPPLEAKGKPMAPWYRIGRTGTRGFSATMNGDGNDDGMDFFLGARARRVKKKIPLARAKQVAKKVERILKPITDWYLLAGSIRRRVPEVGDVEFVVLPRDWEAGEEAVEDLVEALESDGYDVGPARRKATKTVSGVKVEIYLAHHMDELGAMVFMYTGDWQFNIAMRNKAKRRGYKLNQYGIWKDDEPVLQSPYEEEFFKFLDVDYHTPEERSLTRRTEEDRRVRAAVKRKKKSKKRKKVALGGYDDDERGLFGNLDSVWGEEE